MRCTSTSIVLALCLFGAVPASGQKQKREPLTAAQIEQVREAGIDPEVRIALYARFLDEHAATIKSLTARAKTAGRAHALDEELQNFTALLDETGDNLDQYFGRHADLRKALKKLTESAPHWLEILKALPADPPFDVSLKEALESFQDRSDDATRMLKEQDEYFKLHKDEKGQERAEPK